MRDIEGRLTDHCIEITTVIIMLLQVWTLHMMKHSQTWGTLRADWQTIALRSPLCWYNYMFPQVWTCLWRSTIRHEGHWGQTDRLPRQTEDFAGMSGKCVWMSVVSGFISCTVYWTSLCYFLGFSIQCRLADYPDKQDFLGCRVCEWLLCLLCACWVFS